MNDHYSELGVSPSATAGEIKRAYRERATELHPDKGGDAEQFTRVAKAYEVLRDTERKALYDRTGQDERTPIEVEVQNHLFNAFGSVIAVREGGVDVLAIVRMGFENGLEKIGDQKTELRARRKQLLAYRASIKTTGPINICHLIVDKELRAIAVAFEVMKREVEVGKACLKALESYSEVAENRWR